MKNTNPNRVLSQTAGGNCEKVSRCGHDKCVTVAMLLMYLMTEHKFLLAGANFIHSSYHCNGGSCNMFSVLFAKVFATFYNLIDNRSETLFRQRCYLASTKFLLMAFLPQRMYLKFKIDFINSSIYSTALWWVMWAIRYMIFFKWYVRFITPPLL